MSKDPIKDALSHMPYGFYSLTSNSGDEVNAMVVNWVTQASFSPRRIVVALAKKAYSYDLVTSGKVFALNIFNEEDQELIMPFTGGRAKRPEKMENATYTPGPETGCPILEGAAAYIECNVVEIVDIGGDHDLIVGEPVNAALLKEGDVKSTLSLPDLGWSYAG